MPDKTDAIASLVRQWVDKACEKEMPVLAGTLGEIDKALSSDEYSTFALARVILQDPPLTAKVLRVVNSAYYNPGGHRISMVSRAVMILGFDAIRSICVSTAVIAALLHGRARERLFREIAHALYAAVIARELATRRHDPAPEEVFVSTLLRRLGHMVMWSLDEPQSDQLDEAVRDGKGSARDHEIRILGFPLDLLTAALCTTWGLPIQTTSKEGRPESRGHLQDVAWDVANEAGKGWGNGAMLKPVREVAWALTITEQEAPDLLKGLAVETARYALALGSPEVARRVPGQDGAAVDADSESNMSDLGEPDQVAELKVLHEISGNLLENLDVNSIMEMVLEGIHRGVGMDRTALALLDPRTGEVRCKTALGIHRHELIDSFRFLAADPSKHPLVDVMENCKSVLLEPNAPDAEKRFLHPVYELMGDAPFLVQAMSLRGRAIGLIIADRHDSKRAIDRDTWDNFRLLGRQADIALALAAASRER
jgi:HD-like signal output (HDOD) protein